MNTYQLIWAPEGRTIATVQATTMTAARRKAPNPYRKYRGEIDVVEVIEGYDGESGKLLVTMPIDCAQACSQQGAVDGSVEYWLSRTESLSWADEGILRTSLKSIGAWDDLDTADVDIIKGRVLWMAACDWRGGKR